MPKATPAKKRTVDEIDAIAEKLKKSLLTIAQSESSFYDIESSTMDAIAQAGRDFLEHRLSTQDVEAQAVEIEGTRYNKVGRHQKNNELLWRDFG